MRVNNHIENRMVGVNGQEPHGWCEWSLWFGIYCFSAKHVVLRSKSKELQVRNQNIVPEWSNMSIHQVLVQ